MPRVPGTKVWLKKAEFNTVLNEMDKAPPCHRIKIVEEYAEESVHHARQSFEANYGKVHRFIAVSWFNMHVEGIL